MRKWFHRDKHVKVNLQTKGTQLECLFCGAMHIAMVHIAVQGDDWKEDCCSLFDDWTEDGWTVITDVVVNEE